MPPLRERTSDIPALVKAILESLGDTDSPMARSLSSGELLPDLLRHAWPGNVRELRNYIEACIVRQENALAPPASDQPTIDPALPLRAVRDRWIRHVERRYLEAAPPGPRRQRHRRGPRRGDRSGPPPPPAEPGRPALTRCPPMR